MFHTPRQVQRAKQAREFLCTTATPSLRDLKAIIKMNLVKDCPITVEDVNLAEAMFGSDIGVLKGKTTRSKAAPNISDLMEIPKLLIRTNRRVHLCVDVLKICGLCFLATISKNLMHRTCYWIPNLRTKTHHAALDRVLRICNAAGFTVKVIHADGAF